MEKISAVYKIVNTVTSDFYVGSSSNVMKRWADHKCKSMWKRFPNSQLYEDMQKYGVDKFRFQILAPVMPEYLKQVEQELIGMLKPTYNKINASGWDVERRKEYLHSQKVKESTKKSAKKYFQSEKGKEALRRYQNKYYNQLCEYNGKTITLKSLIGRLRYAGIANPTQEAKKYLKK